MKVFTALVVMSREADTALSSIRQKHDPAATDGMPAHITLLAPFVPAELIDERVTSTLSGIFSITPCFDYRLTETGAFPSVLWLAPDPATPFKDLTLKLCEAFPDYQPYGGEHLEIIPHLTFAVRPGAAKTSPVAEQVSALLPIESRAEQVLLMENSSGLWQVMHAFPLQDGKSL